MTSRPHALHPEPQFLITVEISPDQMLLFCLSTYTEWVFFPSFGMYMSNTRSVRGGLWRTNFSSFLHWGELIGLVFFCDFCWSLVQPLCGIKQPLRVTEPRTNTGELVGAEWTGNEPSARALFSHLSKTPPGLRDVALVAAGLRSGVGIVNGWIYRMHHHLKPHHVQSEVKRIPLTTYRAETCF